MCRHIFPRHRLCSYRGGAASNRFKQKLGSLTKQKEDGEARRIFKSEKQGVLSLRRKSVCILYDIKLYVEIVRHGRNVTSDESRTFNADRRLTILSSNGYDVRTDPA